MVFSSKLSGSLSAVAFAILASTVAASADIGPEVANKIRAAMDEVVAAGAPGVIVRIQGGKDALSLAAGRGSISPSAPMQTSHRVRVGSLAKTYVAVVALQLVGEGKLHLGGTVERTLPGVFGCKDRGTRPVVIAARRPGANNSLNFNATTLMRFDVCLLVEFATISQLQGT